MTAMVALGIGALFCLARAFVDFNDRRWGWGVAGLIAGLLLVTVPLPTHAVKVDLPLAASPR